MSTFCLQNSDFIGVFSIRPTWDATEVPISYFKDNADQFPNHSPISPIKKSPNLKKAGTFKNYQFRGKLLNNLFATFDVNTVFSSALNFAT